ncbi:MAG: sulfate respiration complex protein HmcE [bacterium]
MYEFVTGPLAWLAFGVFFIGLTVRIILYIRGLDWKMDRVTYRVNTSYGIRGAIRSVVSWLIPFGTGGWKTHPVFTVITFGFHLSLLISAIFLPAHNFILKRKWGVSLFTIPEVVGDMMAILVMIAVVMFIVRRLVLPEVRILTTAYDYLILAIAVAPFITGFIAYHQIFEYKLWLILHILSGEILLIAIPFTKLSHFVLFFMSRIQIGMDFGIKRGGMKGSGLTW